MIVLTALDAARALVVALGLPFGEVTVQVFDGEVRIVRKLDTLKPAELERLPVPEKTEE